MKVTFVVDKPGIAQVLVDPMRRAILELLRVKPMTQANLAQELGLSGASLNYHMKMLRSKKLVVIVRRESEIHGIMQKFFAPAAYLFIYDLDSLPKNIARYFYPVSLERTRAIISTMLVEHSRFPIPPPDVLSTLSEKISREMVMAAKKYQVQEAESGVEEVIYKIYSDAIKRTIR